MANNIKEFSVNTTNGSFLLKLSKPADAGTPIEISYKKSLIQMDMISPEEQTIIDENEQAGANLMAIGMDGYSLFSKDEHREDEDEDDKGRETKA